jgi:hypothetical protein
MIRVLVVDGGNGDETAPVPVVGTAEGLFGASPEKSPFGGGAGGGGWGEGDDTAEDFGFGSDNEDMSFGGGNANA